MTANVAQNGVEHIWHGEGVTWVELRGHPLVKELRKKPDDLARRIAMGKKGAKGTAKGNSSGKPVGAARRPGKEERAPDMVSPIPVVSTSAIVSPNM